MMNYIWAGMMIFAFLSAVMQGNMSELSASILSGGSDAVALCIKLLGMLCLWGGIMNIAEKSGLANAVCRLLSPFIKLVFPKMDSKSPAARAISMNVTANLLGLGNAATPLGLEAMKRLQEGNPSPLVASNEMISFLVLNSAALHLLPTTVAMLRQEFGSKSPMDIMPAAWLTSIAALTVGLTMAWLMRGRRYRHG